MSIYSKQADKILGNSINGKLVTRTPLSRQNDPHLDSPLLSSYNREELLARENTLTQTERRRDLDITARARKALADSLRDQFELTGSDLPADANPRQLHLF